MLHPTPLPLLLDALSAGNSVPSSIKNAFNMMLLQPPFVSPNNLSNKRGATATEEALTLSGINDVRLNNCVVTFAQSHS